jgi:hypothetical protein
LSGRLRRRNKRHNRPRIAPAAGLFFEHDPEKREAVFRKIMLKQ